MAGGRGKLSPSPPSGKSVVTGGAGASPQVGREGEALNMTSPAPSELSGRLGINDAEMNLFRAAQEQGATINAIGATRPVCVLCQRRLPNEIPIVTDLDTDEAST